MPADLVGKDLTRGIWQGLSTRIQIAAVVAALSISLAVTHTLPGEAQPAGSRPSLMSIHFAIHLCIRFFLLSGAGLPQALTIE